MKSCQAQRVGNHMALRRLERKQKKSSRKSISKHSPLEELKIHLMYLEEAMKNSSFPFPAYHYNPCLTFPHILLPIPKFHHSYIQKFLFSNPYLFHIRNF